MFPAVLTAAPGNLPLRTSKGSETEKFSFSGEYGVVFSGLETRKTERQNGVVPLLGFGGPVRAVSLGEMKVIVVNRERGLNIEIFLRRETWFRVLGGENGALFLWGLKGLNLSLDETYSLSK